MKQGIIFDLDGTLWDSSEAVTNSWNEALNKKGITKYHMTLSKMQGYMGKPMDEIAYSFFSGMEKEKALDLLKECCKEEEEYILHHGGRLFDGLEETLAILHKKYHLSIVSNCQCGYIEAFLKYHHLESYFDDWECYGNTNLSKGRNIRLVMERNHLKQIVYVGDTMGDYEACQEAEVPFALAEYGFGDVAHPDFVLKSIRELPKLSETFFETKVLL